MRRLCRVSLGADCNTPAGTHPCKKPRCKTCLPILKRTDISVTADEKHTICGHFTCQSTSVVYIISCRTSNAANIGETGCPLQERMNQHRFSVNHEEDTPVSEHFQDGHQPMVSVLQSAPSDTLQRCLIEQRWIKRLSQPHSLLRLINRDGGIDALSLD